MNAQDQIAFYLTGRTSISGGAQSSLEPFDRSYHPALFARYGDLTSLRYDYPMVLNSQGDLDRALLSLSGLVDEAVESLADDPVRDRIARHGYELEREIRSELSSNTMATAAGHNDFAVLWESAAKRLAQKDPNTVDSAKRLWAMFNANGELAHVDFAMPARVTKHVWNAVQGSKAKTFRKEIERLLLKLHGILKAELASSEEGRAPKRLEASMGTAFAGAFDFDVMSEVLVRAKPGVRISDDRRKRITLLIDVLEHQRFFPVSKEVAPYEFVFYRCATAVEAYKARRSEGMELLKALEIARLEVNGEYRESAEYAADGRLDHTALFEDFGLEHLDAGVLSALPDYLLCKYTSELDAEETLQIVDALSSGLPIKVLLQTDDLFEPSQTQTRLTNEERQSGLASRSRFVIEAAIASNDVFVMQASASHLFDSKDSLQRGFTYSGPAIFSVFSGVNAHARGIAPYLVAAAAVESRAFPTILYDPSSGAVWANRFSLDGNPNREAAWPEHSFDYEDESLQTHSEDLTFTFADFLALDERFSRHFAIVPKAEWNSGMTSVPKALSGNSSNSTNRLPNSIPSITVVGARNNLARAILDRQALEATRRCEERWHTLQELGGIHNSYAERAAAHFEEQLAAALAKAQVAPANAAQATAQTPASVAPQSTPIAAEEPAAAKEVRGNDPYIETPRCTSCNECTQVNNKMFAYNDEKQAYIADANAGTYRQLVEAAEGCQVSIIHPGKPKNPKEPGLEDLMKRAEPFM